MVILKKFSPLVWQKLYLTKLWENFLNQLRASWTRLEEIEKFQDWSEREHDEQSKRIAYLENEVKGLKLGNTDNSNKLQEIEKDIDQVNYNNGITEYKSRLINLEIGNMPQDEREDPNFACMLATNIARKLANTDGTLIEVAHRVRTRATNKPEPIIVRFKSIEARNHRNHIY